MPNTRKTIDPLPDEFRSEDEAAEFWDKHSLADYEKDLKPVDVEVNINRRHYEIEVDEESFRALRVSARKQRKPVKTTRQRDPQTETCIALRGNTFGWELRMSMGYRGRSSHSGWLERPPRIESLTSVARSNAEFPSPVSR